MSLCFCGDLFCVSKPTLPRSTGVETATSWARLPGRRDGGSDAIAAGRRRRGLRRGCSCCFFGPLAARQRVSAPVSFSLVVRPRRAPRGDGRRSWRRLVGEPAGRSRQQPRYPLCPRARWASPAPARAPPRAPARAAAVSGQLRPAVVRTAVAARGHRRGCGAETH